ncbi:cathelicidin antimicrobial peptide [Pipistrellus kuhlii]|uniref:Cathelicidin antimicrobial peptide n=1 Tax=Pipistrellus kuhlii TaxID=59472 RepID=A0A7J7WC85_PIPKU|nr:cathelicidin antimicrobial peptide [Pipistrellus kuhlii]KAF6334921.1 cathelicidin antimicrobial peptide [Pipistrellus kuhlii]
METQGSCLCGGRRALLLLLLLGLAMPPPAAQAAQALSYQQAVRLAVLGFNQRSREPSLYRLVRLDPPPPPGDLSPEARRPVSFTLQETVCPRTTRRPPEECDFREEGLLKECSGSVILDPDNGYFDVTCEEIKKVNLDNLIQKGREKLGRLRELFRKGGQKVGKLLQKGGQKLGEIGQRIRDFFSNLRPREEGPQPRGEGPQPPEGGPQLPEEDTQPQEES